jgi:hypothetical protein
MPADLEAVALRTQVVGVVDHPDREPEDLLLESGQVLQAGGGISGVRGYDLGGSWQGGVLRCARSY